MKKLIVLPKLSFILSILGTSELKAAHILGMNITYENIGGDSFVV